MILTDNFSQFISKEVVLMNARSLPAKTTLPYPPKLLDLVVAKTRFKHYSRRTEQSYPHWIRPLILFHGKYHPQGDGRTGNRSFSFCTGCRPVCCSQRRVQQLPATFAAGTMCAYRFTVCPVMQDRLKVNDSRQHQTRASQMGIARLSNRSGQAPFPD